MLRGSEASQDRRLITAGAAFLVVAALVVVIVARPFGGSGPEPGHIRITVDVPYVGQGVREGTTIMAHGLPIGTVTDLTPRAEGGLRLAVDIDPSGPQLTEGFELDYRPANYFGVTAVNVIATGRGATLRDGIHLTKTPVGNFTIQSLLSRLGEVSGGVLTNRLIMVVDKATRYTDGLDPLIESMLISADALARVQTVPTRRLMANATEISAAFPAFLTGAITATHGMFDTEVATVSEDEYRNKALATLDIIANSLFGALGKLLGSHQGELLPATRIVAMLAGLVPPIAAGAALPHQTAALRERLNRLLGGDQGRDALRVRIVVDRLPALAGPLAVIGADR